MSRLRLPSPAMIVACLALAVAIGGSAYAASKINGKDIKADSITGKQIKEKTVKNVASAKKAKKAKRANSAKRADTANRLGGQNADDLKVRWLLIGGDGQIEEQSGGFSILDAYATNQNVYIDAGESTAGHGLFATIATVNKGDEYSPGSLDTNFNGEVSVARCQTAMVECAPANSKNGNAFVVAPRLSNGDPTGPTTRKAVYVEFTE